MPIYLPVIVLLLASIMWGLSWLPLKGLHGLGVDGIPLTLAAFGATALVLVPTLWLQRSRWRGQTRWLLLIALLGGYANLAFTTAMVYGEVVRVMVLFYLLPVWGVLGGRLFLGEHIDAARWLAVALALTGAFLILGGFEALHGKASWVDLLALTCGMALAGNILVFRAEQSIPVPSKVAAMLLGASVLAAGVIAVGLQPMPDLPASSWGWAAAYGLFWALIATVGTQWAVTHMESGRASILIILELVTAVVSAMIIAGERMEGWEWVGAALIVGATLIEARRSAAPDEYAPTAST